jgi:hypothetical protein
MIYVVVSLYVNSPFVKKHRSPAAKRLQIDPMVWKVFNDPLSKVALPAVPLDRRTDHPFELLKTINSSPRGV